MHVHCSHNTKKRRKYLATRDSTRHNETDNQKQVRLTISDQLQSKSEAALKPVTGTVKNQDVENRNPNLYAFTHSILYKLFFIEQ